MTEDVRYIFSTGDLMRLDNSIVFKSNGKNNYIPIEKIKELYCFNDQTITTKLLEILGKAGIIVHFFNYYGQYVGTFYPKEQLISGNITIKQANYYSTKREDVAKSIVYSIAENIKFVLYHYYRHGKKEVKNVIDYIDDEVPILLMKANNINQIMMIEGTIWGKFYDSFKYFLPEDFIMNKRVRRPPDNPINCLISFGNSMLYTKTITQLYYTHLNQSISFLHSPSEGRFSLSLDISEAFKPLIVFRTIFDCVNNRKITVDKHFEQKFNYCLLNDVGKKIFVTEFDERINDTFKHSKLNRKVSYKQCIKLDGYKLCKSILEEGDFIPYVETKKQ